ncbi:hypothetical protein TREMEDRAFT_61657 [Tremella mesenterica DSM 1558]|uniref:uncharacterized protein n=1 Tax=Tremella mesenterica (strain ATCC 24925 / CBS 8224 / DSM 1558 / NBRC 9311 / NRRL Y-6157 / RJB 2259-6 / UBC 559-6) TaxID=578456 RepID=UPI0003F49A92|nr:uncharacterized protein TREMEDRAFT_61657 [Tremella mesenterica DSM 1558]EIW69886.1 hypothetical protein TREMEDRAFT_61657 [Tremella mesenterica DSM 1558]
MLPTIHIHASSDPGPSKLFSLPSISLFRSSEKQPSISSTSVNMSIGHSGAILPGAPHLPLRRRRMVTQGVAVTALLSLCLLWFTGGAGMGTLLAPPKPDWTVEQIPPGRVIDPEIAAHLGKPKGPPEFTGYPIPSPDLSLWGLDLRSDRLLAGISPWPPNPAVEESQPALSSLGHFADNIYKHGPLDLETYSTQLREFAEVAFPRNIAEELKKGIEMYLGEGRGDKEIDENVPGPEAWDKQKFMWQTDKDERREQSVTVASWTGRTMKDEGWNWELMTDQEADQWMRKKLPDSRIELMWTSLPTGILRSDMIRYLLLLIHGGIYSDTDTALLKPPSDWGKGARLWRDGLGWIGDADKARIDAGEEVDDVIGKPSVVVGIEADVGDRSDWYEWWPRPIQIVQWTMASAPYHPICLQALLRILHSTAHAVQWSHEHRRNLKALTDLGMFREVSSLREVTVLSEPKGGGPVGVMAWTGPGVWTDAVLSYIRVRYGVQWTDLRELKEPLRIGDVMVLPVTGFSPGVGNFGSEPAWHPQAMVEHKFEGSWKNAIP